MILYWFAYEISIDGFNKILNKFDKQKYAEDVGNSGFPVRWSMILGLITRD